MLLIEAGKVINRGRGNLSSCSLPYGPKARLLLMHLNSEAVRRQSPIIPVEDSMTAFFRRLMGRTQDGRQAAMLKTQLSALAAATFRMGISTAEDSALQIDTKVIGAFDLWFRKDEDGQRVIWPQTLRLSLDYFESLTRFAVPLDERPLPPWRTRRSRSISTAGWRSGCTGCWTKAAAGAVGQSAGAVRPRICPTRAFREFFIGLLRQVRSVYPEARLEVDSHGMRLWQSPPPVRKRLVAIDAAGSGNVQSVAGDSSAQRGAKGALCNRWRSDQRCRIECGGRSRPSWRSHCRAPAHGTHGRGSAAPAVGPHPRLAQTSPCCMNWRVWAH